MTSNLVKHAENELDLAGYTHTEPDVDEPGKWDPDYEVRKAVLELVEKFAEQGHSGFSASVVIGMVVPLLRFEPLTPITDNPDEWMPITSLEPATDSPNMWQSRRDPRFFSLDGGKTYHNVDERSNFLGRWLRTGKGWRHSLFRWVWDNHHNWIHKTYTSVNMKETND